MPRIDAPTVAEHNAMRRRQVVDAAALVLSEVGAAAFTPAAVAKQAGLARSSMYQYYPSTDALLGAAVAEMLERSRDRMIAAVAAADTPAERVTAYVREAIDDATSGHATIPDLSGMHMPEVCREGVRALHDELLAPLRAALRRRRGRQSGDGECPGPRAGQRSRERCQARGPPRSPHNRDDRLRPARRGTARLALPDQSLPQELALGRAWQHCKNR
ncbi:MAG: TetR/AcrR family transcriptional regulator [Dermatophilaceae bacterium]